MTDLIITPAIESDLPAILAVQKKAFREVARMFNVKSLPPLEQTLESVMDEYEHGTFLKASVGNAIVGSIRAHLDGDTCHIGKLVVLPEYQNRGIGRALMRDIENHYKDTAKRYELFTGERDPRNRHLYDQLGYKPFKTAKFNDDVTFVYMEKNMGPELR